MKFFSFYDPATGLIHERQFYTTNPTEEAVRMNTPAGHRAIEGRHDRKAKMVDESTGEPQVIDRLATVRKP